MCIIDRGCKGRVCRYYKIIKMRVLFPRLLHVRDVYKRQVLTYMISTALKKFDGKVTASEIGLPVSSNGLVLPLSLIHIYTSRLSIMDEHYVGSINWSLLMNDTALLI